MLSYLAYDILVGTLEEAIGDFVMYNQQPLYSDTCAQFCVPSLAQS